MRKFVFWIFIFLIFSCTNPIQNDYRNQTSKPIIIYKANKFENIKEIAVSPDEKLLAVVKESKALQIDNGSALKQYVLPFHVNRNFKIAPNLAALAFIKNQDLFVEYLVSGQERTYSFNKTFIQNFKWQNDTPALIVLCHHNNFHQIFQIHVNNEPLTANIIYQESRRSIKSVDFNSHKNLMVFTASLPSNDYYLYFFRVNTSQIDSVPVAPNARYVSLEKTGEKLAWAEGSLIKIANLTQKTVQQIQLQHPIIAPPLWSGNRLIVKTETGFLLLSLQNNQGSLNTINVNHFKNKADQMAWQNNNSNPVLITLIKKNQLLIFNTKTHQTFQKISFGQDELSNLSWNESDDKLLLLKNAQVLVLNVKTLNSQQLSLPFEYFPIVRWGPEKDWLAFIGKSAQSEKQYLYDLNNKQIKEFPLELNSSIQDFSWASKTKKVLYSIPDISRLFTYKYTGTSLKYEKAYTLVAEAVCWAPNNTAISKKIGEYAVFKSQPSLGIYFLKSNNLNWLLHLQSQNIKDFDWNADGKSIYYVFNDGNQPPQIILEQIIYIDEK